MEKVGIGTLLIWLGLSLNRRHSDLEFLIFSMKRRKSHIDLNLGGIWTHPRRHFCLDFSANVCDTHATTITLNEENKEKLKFLTRLAQNLRRQTRHLCLMDKILWDRKDKIVTISWRRCSHIGYHGFYYYQQSRRRFKLFYVSFGNLASEGEEAGSSSLLSWFIIFRLTKCVKNYRPIGGTLWHC